MRVAKQPDQTNRTEVYTVPDESIQDVSQVSVTSGPKETVVVQPQQNERAEVKSKSMLEDLIFLGRTSRNVEIGGFDFELSTLTQQESTSLMKNLFQLSGDGSDVFLMRSMTMAYAIRSVNGVPLEDVPLPGDQVYETAYKKRLAVIDNMQRTIVEKLHDEYVDLSEKTEEALDGEDLKNS
jgi:hypothetical protein